MTRIVALILSAIALATSALSHADDASAAPHIIVQFVDLDLGRVEGAAKLYGRLHAAAERVCSPLNAKELARALRYRQCVADALSGAVARVDRPALSAYYRTKTEGGKPAPVIIAKHP